MSAKHRHLSVPVLRLVGDACCGSGGDSSRQIACENSVHSGVAWFTMQRRGFETIRNTIAQAPSVSPRPVRPQGFGDRGGVPCPHGAGSNRAGDAWTLRGCLTDGLTDRVPATRPDVDSLCAPLRKPMGVGVLRRDMFLLCRCHHPRITLSRRIHRGSFHGDRSFCALHCNLVYTHRQASGSSRRKFSS